MDIHGAMKSDRLMKAVIGMSIKEFESLKYSFANALNKNKKVKENRQRKEGGGNTHTLKNIEDKLFFILFFMKCYPTFDLAGFFYNVNKSQISRWVNALLPILEKALGYEIVLPIRRINSVEEFLRQFPEAKDIFIDGSERPIRRPKKSKSQTKNYSGKKKKHTRKNIIINDDRKRILVVSPTKAGKIHDKKLIDKFEYLKNIPPDVTVWTDTGFQGAKQTHENTIMPKKRSRGSELTIREKEENKAISQIRILSENAIAGIKRFRCVTDVYRNRIGNMDDKFILIAAGLWNYHLKLA